MKESLRDGIAKYGLGEVHASVRKAYWQNVDHLFQGSLSERFSAIYTNRVCLPLTRSGREVLFHLSFKDISRLRDNVRKSDAQYLIATNDTDLKYNAGVLSEDYRMLNLLRAPLPVSNPYCQGA